MNHARVGFGGSIHELLAPAFAFSRFQKRATARRLLRPGVSPQFAPTSPKWSLPVETTALPFGQSASITGAL
jgi:hypothetical protein